jgi:hypothetical protein
VEVRKRIKDKAPSDLGIIETATATFIAKTTETRFKIIFEKLGA